MNLYINVKQLPTDGKVAGVLCVDKHHRQKGLGKALVQRCEDIAMQLWKVEQIHAEVDVENTKALEFFKLCGFTTRDNDENGESVMVDVRRHRKLEQRPHTVLAKTMSLATE